jgi:hypothetical protein
MKTCPICKANYNDESLNFCLNDGATLSVIPDEQVTKVILPTRVTNQSTFQNAAPISYNVPSAPAKSNKTAFIATALALLLLLFIGGVIAALILIPRDAGKTDSELITPSPTPKDDSTELKEKIANLERQIQNQKISPSPTPYSTFTPTSTQTPLDRGGKATARVAQSNDGFLSLRTEPSVRTGTQLVKIPSGSTVELEDCQPNYQTIDGRRGRWCMISYAGETGWAFDAWLIY